jgi:hypothetical protein
MTNSKNTFFILLGALLIFMIVSCSKHKCPDPIVNEPAPGTLKNGLVAHYPFTGNAGDSSGFSNHGTVIGATLTTDRFGKPDKAYNFDGNDYISISPANLKIGTYTYAAWVKVNVLPGNNESQSIISIGTVNGDQNMTVANNYSTGSASGFAVGGYDAGGNTVSVYISGIMPSTSNWYHLVYTRDENDVKFYLNGGFIGSNPVNGTAYYGTSSQTAYFGVRSHSSVQYFKGAIDDIRIYNRALTASEVIQLYQLN